MFADRSYHALASGVNFSAYEDPQENDCCLLLRSRIISDILDHLRRGLVLYALVALAISQVLASVKENVRCIDPIARFGAAIAVEHRKYVEGVLVSLYCVVHVPIVHNYLTGVKYFDETLFGAFSTVWESCI